MFKQKPNPESPEVLAAFVPTRRVTVEELHLFIELLRGALIDGRPLDKITIAEDAPQYWRIRVEYNRYSRTVLYEDIYLYKQYPEPVPQQVSCLVCGNYRILRGAWGTAVHALLSSGWSCTTRDGTNIIVINNVHAWFCPEHASSGVYKYDTY